ncbi:hypothetical protein TIFTF001_042077 [Ficus carica]|uniref:Uncharacterized protein n=1 Tax=Ficus carica TaxID=3494 RepID=A0AA87ZJM7_FICCA|nr:hypothetical protein TIFTF001_042075 [Ficus carica]GMN34572.1 hypothetical protein TIFTF001_042077 [Ficus carica]
MAPAPEGAPANFCINIYTVFREDQDHDPNIKVPISIFNVPKSLTASKPDAYVPRLVGWDLSITCDLMQTYKLTEVKRLHKEFGSVSFERLVEILNKLVNSPIRASYGTFLDMDNESLACIVAVDGLFLFELLCCYGISQGDLVQSEFLLELVKSAGRRLARDTTLGDATVLENQIPILALNVLLIVEICSEVKLVTE